MMLTQFVQVLPCTFQLYAGSLGAPVVGWAEGHRHYLQPPPAVPLVCGNAVHRALLLHGGHSGSQEKIFRQQFLEGLRQIQSHGSRDCFLYSFVMLLQLTM